MENLNAAAAPCTEQRWLVYRVDRSSDGFRPVADRVVLVDHGTGLGVSVRRQLAPPAPPLDVDDPVDVVRELCLVLRPGRAGRTLVEFAGSAPVAFADDEVVEQVLRWLTLERLAAGDGSATLHAGAVADESGAAVVMLGPSGTGKSTLAAHLVAAGMSLLTDEQLTVHPAGRTVSAFTRPIALRPSGREHAPAVGLRGRPNDRIAPVDLGSEHRLLAAPALLVVLRRDGTDPVAWRPLHTPNAIEALCANSLDLALRSGTVLPTLVSLAANTPTVELNYGASSDAAEALGALLADPPPSPKPEWRVIEPPRAPGPGARDAVRWSPDVVTVVVGDEAVVYHRTIRLFVQLNRSATRLWLSLREGRRSTRREQPFLDELEWMRLLHDTPDRRRRRRAAFNRLLDRHGRRQWIGWPVRSVRAVQLQRGSSEAPNEGRAG